MPAPKYVINVHGHLHHDQNIEERIKLWRKYNVRKFCALCFQPRWRSKANDQYFTNEDLIPWLKRYPDLLVGMGSINLSKNPDPPEKIDELKAQGFTGLKFIDCYYPYNHEIYFPLYARAEKLGMPICFHTGIVATTEDDGKYGIDANNMRPYYLDKIARAFPRLKLIGFHLGKPHAEEALMMISEHRNIYYDFSGGGGEKVHERWVLRSLSPMPGANIADPTENLALDYFQKLCFGTDNPEPPVWIEVANRIIDKLCIPQELQERFYWQNAAQIFGWTESDLQ
jgi:hypothetical protein